MVLVNRHRLAGCGGIVNLLNRAAALARHYIEIVIILGLVMGYALLQSYQYHRAAAIIAEPQKSDFYFVDYVALNPGSDKRFRFVPMKILEVKSDGIVFKVGNIGHTKPVSARRHMEFDRPMLLRNFYRQDPLTLSHRKIEELFESGVIYDARRPQTIYIDGWIVIHKHEMYLE